MSPESRSVATAICGDGPMAGEEFTVHLDRDGQPADVVDVAGRTYQLAVQPPPTGTRPWRYTTVRAGTLVVLDGRSGNSEEGFRR